MSNRLALPFSRSDLARLPGNGEAFLASLPVPGPRAGPSGHFPNSLVADAAAPVEREEISIDALRFRHLRTSTEIDCIKHLREKIQLPASALADPGFQTGEKKETSRGSSVLSSARDGLSARSASCRWG